MRVALSVAATIALSAWSGTLVAAPIGSSFSYQGRLNASGSPAGGSHDFEFGLYDAASGGGQIGTTVSLTTNVDGGLFSATLDFGAGAFAGDRRWLEIRVRPGGPGAYTN